MINVTELKEVYFNPVGNALFYLSMMGIAILIIYLIIDKLKRDYDKSNP